MIDNEQIITQGNVISVYFNVKAGWEQWVLLSSDEHHDSVYCNREMEKRHLDKALDRRALIMHFGDYFDAMQGRYDKRRSMEELREEFRVSEYYDAITEDAIAFQKPYAANTLLYARGNHESAVLKNANTDLLERLRYKLNNEAGGNIQIGGYGGWVRFMFMSEGVPMRSIKLKYFHGSGGEAPVTRGAIQTNRQAVYLPDANIVVNGHSHNNYYIPISRERLSNKGVQYFDIQHHVRVPGYKQAYADGSGGWEVERGGVPKPIGAVWMRMFYYDSQLRMEFTEDIAGPEVIQPVGIGFDGKVYDDDSEGE